MADFPYDLNTYSIPELDTENDVMFNHISSRELILSEISGWVENNPSDTITGSLYINGCRSRYGNNNNQRWSRY